jgi:hypothetical protein
MHYAFFNTLEGSVVPKHDAFFQVCSLLSQV